MRIIFFSNIPAPYVVEYLNELGKLADVIAVFEQESYAHRDNSWKRINNKHFSFHFLKGIRLNKTRFLSLSFKKYLKQYADAKIIIANPTTPTGILLIWYCKKHHLKYILQSEGGLPKTGRGFKEKFKTKLLSGATLYLSGMKPEKDYFRFYGAPLNKIKTYPFASLHEEDFPKTITTPEEKKALKNELDIKYETIILYVGRIIHQKGLDILIKSIKGISKSVGVYLVGGQPTKEYSKLIDDLGLNHNIVFVRHLDLETLSRYYQASDIFVLPTRGDTWGLVINEAMSFGLPVITTQKCVAGMQLIENDVNGYIIDADNPNELRKKLIFLLDKPNLRMQMGTNNHKKIEGYTYENMAKIIFEYVSEIEN